VDGLSLTLEPGEALGIVGESGSGKSVAMLAVLGLVPFPGRVSATRIAFAGTDLHRISPRKRRAFLGRELAMVFQEPMTSLNPSFTIGFQIEETLRVHERLGRSERRQRAIELLEQVGIPSPETRREAYPHQLSGGMNQRVMIAMAIACRPQLLIADEPTTALDVTIQAQILDLLLRLQREQGLALLLISHDMGVVAQIAQRVLVMYAGQVVEEQKAERLFAAPRHPYTAALLNALPERAAAGERLIAIEGSVPGLHDRPKGCLFAPRCVHSRDRCREEQPDPLSAPGGTVRCFYPLETGS
jgi:dipeptide transport system ATP-binding protein